MAIKTTDHLVPHTSMVPATKDQQIELFVREHDGTPSGHTAEREAVLMLHGRSVPVLAGFDLQHGTYGWGEALAKAGYDVFMMDLQGSGGSTRPRMEDPCNVNPALHTTLLTPNPLSGQRTPSYPFQLNNSQSDWDELDTVVEYIRTLRNVSKVAFIGWSAASFQMGPYAIDNPGKVSSLFLVAPMFPPLGRMDPPSTLPAAGFPTHVFTRDGFQKSWDPQIHCSNQREPGMVDVVWKALMAIDPIGRTWGKVQSSGKPMGLSRFRNALWWGWNTKAAARGGVLGGSVPVLIAYGEYDTTANTTPPSSDPLLNFSVPALYDAIKGPHRLLVKMACAGHQVVWEGQHKNLHNLSKHWLKHAKVDGKTHGSFDMAEDGTISPAP
ncbi:alpha/beta fold hydrolase [Streptomyces sp. NPDC059875]|uniref:alpha/beta fold hydrolase n=1 Tax=unclassified Streptomyces TaxID=2593676 RepID=UPI003662BD53